MPSGETADYLQDSYWPTIGIPEVPGFARLSVVGSGGSATVYKAVELRHDRPVAIKILDVQAGDSQRRAFTREVDAIARIVPHPNVITLLGSGVTPDDHPYLVFPFFGGGTFAAWIDERGPLTWSAAIDISIKICSAVETVHRAGLIHRDIKPGNLFIGVTPAHPVLGDFGISTLIEGVPSRTVQQAVTVGYTAPEILHDKPASTISDIYSLGMTIFRIVQGLHAYYAESPAAVMRNVLNQSNAPHLSAGVPPSLDKAVTRALSEDPAERPQTAIELARELQAVQADHYLPVTPVLVNGEPGILGEPPLPPSPVLVPHPADLAQSTAHGGIDNSATDSSPAPPVDVVPNVATETMQLSRATVKAESSFDLPERADPGAILAAAVNGDGGSQDGESRTDGRRRRPIEGRPPEPPRNTDTGNRVAQSVRRLQTEPELNGPGAAPLDRPTESRPRVTRTELLAPKAPVKKRRWWSRKNQDS